MASTAPQGEKIGALGRGNPALRSGVVDDVPFSRTRSLLALVASIAAHAAVILAAAGGASAARPPDIERSAPSADPWIGDTFEVSETVVAAGGEETTGSPAMPASPAVQGPTAVTPQEAPTVAALTPPQPRPGNVSRSRAKQQPRPAASQPTPASSSLSSSDSGQGGSDSANNSGGSGRYGMAGPGVAGPRDLARAFTRAIPIAVSADPVWATVPLGSAGSFDLRIELGEDGRIASATPNRAVAEHLRVVAARTVKMLGAGVFATRAEAGAGVEVLRLGVTISQVEGQPTDDRSQAGAYGLGFEPPRDGKPGKAHFTLRSGRHIEISVRVVGSQ